MQKKLKEMAVQNLTRLLLQPEQTTLSEAVWQESALFDQDLKICLNI